MHQNRFWRVSFNSLYMHALEDDDILRHIFLSIVKDPKSLFTAMNMVCKGWQWAAESSFLWRKLWLRDFDISIHGIYKSLYRYIATCPNVVLIVADAPGTDTGVVVMEPSKRGHIRYVQYATAGVHAQRVRAFDRGVCIATCITPTIIRSGYVRWTIASRGTIPVVTFRFSICCGIFDACRYEVVTDAHQNTIVRELEWDDDIFRKVVLPQCEEPMLPRPTLRWWVPRCLRPTTIA